MIGVNVTGKSKAESGLLQAARTLLKIAGTNPKALLAVADD